MLRTEIKREKFSSDINAFDNTLDELVEILNKESQQTLGYTLPKPEEYLENDPLLGVVAKLGFEILNWRNVFQFKVEEENHAKLEKLKKEYLTQHSYPRWTSFPSWVETEISKYVKHIPSHILQRAIELKKALPSVEIFIESLEENPDPFLVAKLKNPNGYDFSVVYLDYWDEPYFKQV